MRYLGLDYGLKKIGLATSEGQIASPLKVLDISSLADAVNKILHVIKQQQIDRVVVGVPESGIAKSAVKKFITKLKADLKENPVSVIEADETLSTSSAKDLMIDLGMGEKARQKEDAYAAVIILQNFLDSIT
jgi:putative Holliday junction resolvase